MVILGYLNYKVKEVEDVILRILNRREKKIWHCHMSGMAHSWYKSGVNTLRIIFLSKRPLVIIQALSIWAWTAYDSKLIECRSTSQSTAKGEALKLLCCWMRHKAAPLNDYGQFIFFTRVKYPRLFKQLVGVYTGRERVLKGRIISILSATYIKK